MTSQQLATALARNRELEERLRRLTWHDLLTGLPNRTLLNDRLEQALLNAQRFDRSAALLLIDLVRFRLINDTLGHAVGDAVLVGVARRLEQVGRPGDTVARLGADEFAVVLANLGKETDVVALASEILDTLATPFDFAGQQLSVAANIGIGLFPKDAADLNQLFKAADIALERAGKSGRNTFRFFTAAMDQDAARRLRLESNLRTALERGELSIHYQPQVNLAHGAVCGCEALLRWQHPELGMVSPAEFIPLAEEAGLIEKLGTWVLREVCFQNKAWLDAGLPMLPIAVNVSPKQLHHGDLVGTLAALLTESGLPAAGLEIELTETAFIEDLDKAKAIIEKIKALGVRLAIDDFGTGYASLSLLSSIAFDKIKIDQSFVRDIVGNPVNAAIAGASIAMGRSLDLVVLAEGVENEAQMHFLRDRQCEAMQGWLFSKALPPAEYAALLQANTALEVGADGTAIDTLLLLDDEASILSALRRLLRREGYRILSASNSQAAFDLLARNAVQVIVSDQRMPDMSGTEFLARVKQLYPDTIRIVLSGYADLQTVTDAVNRGAIYRFLTKPWDDEALRTQIRDAFRTAQGLVRD